MKGSSLRRPGGHRVLGWRGFGNKSYQLEGLLHNRMDTLHYPYLNL